MKNLYFIFIFLLSFNSFASEERCTNTMNQFLGQIPPQGQSQFNNPGRLNKVDSRLSSSTALANIRRAGEAQSRSEEIDSRLRSSRTRSLRADEVESDRIQADNDIDQASQATEERDQALSQLRPNTAFISLFAGLESHNESLEFDRQVVFSGSGVYPQDSDYLNNDPVMVALQNGNHTQAFIFRTANRKHIIAEFTPDCYIKRMSFYDYGDGDINEPFNSNFISSVTDELCNDFRQNLDIVTQFISNSYGTNNRLKENHQRTIRRLMTGSNANFPQETRLATATDAEETYDLEDVTPAYVNRMHEACENYRPHMRSNFLAPASSPAPTDVSSGQRQ